MPDDRTWAIVALLVGSIVIVTAALYAGVQGSDDRWSTPTISLSEPTVENNLTAIIDIVGISSPDVAYQFSGIRVILPNSTTILWTPGSTGWTASETSYRNATLGLTITLKANANTDPRYFEVRDRITIESGSPFDEGHWAVALVYYATANLMATTGFVQ